MGHPVYSINERRGSGADPIPVAFVKMHPVLGSQPAGDRSHKPKSRLPLHSFKSAITFPVAQNYRRLVGYQIILLRDRCTWVKQLAKNRTEPATIRVASSKLYNWTTHHATRPYTIRVGVAMERPGWPKPPQIPSKNYKAKTTYYAALLPPPSHSVCLSVCLSVCPSVRRSRYRYRASRRAT